MRIYTGKHADRGGQPDRWKRVLPWVAVGVAIGLQLLAVLLPDASDAMVPALLVAYLSVTVLHGVVSRGSAWTAVFVGIGLIFGLVVESLGAATGFPFGASVYDHSVGPTIFRVPVLAILAWPATSYLVLVAVERLSMSTINTTLVGGWLFAWMSMMFDPVTDPTRLNRDADWLLPGTTLPLQYVLGLILTGILLFLILDRMPRKIANDTLPFSALSWMFVSGIVGTTLVGQSSVAIWAGVCAGLVMLPLWWKLWSEPNW